MDSSEPKPVCTISLYSLIVVIGSLQAVFYGGVFVWMYAIMIVDYILSGISVQYLLRALILTELDGSGSLLSSSIFNILLVIGIRKSIPGFLLTWLINQALLIVTAILTLLYFTICSYLHVPVVEGIVEVAIMGYHVLCFLAVYVEFTRMRSGNLFDEDC